MIKKALTLAIAAAITGLTGCGGSSSPSDTLSQPSSNQNQVSTSEDMGQPVTSKGVITGFGSVIVNGVHFKTQKSVFRDEDEESSEDRLTIGMEVEIRGTINEDGTEGEAELIEFDPHIEG